MGRLRDRMDEDMLLGGLSANTRKTYLYCVAVFVRHYMRPRSELGAEHVSHLPAPRLREPIQEVGRRDGRSHHCFVSPRRAASPLRLPASARCAAGGSSGTRHEQARGAPRMAAVV
jgi:hypothetical protein